MEKPNIIGLSIIASLFIFVSVSYIVHQEGGLTGEVASGDPIQIPAAGYAGYHGWTQPGQYDSPSVKVSRAVPRRIYIPDDVWNFGTLNEILKAAMSQLDAAKNNHVITEAQYEMLQIELFNIQQSLGVCVGETDAKTMIRSRYGGSGTTFSDLYPKMMACMVQKMAEAKAKAPKAKPAEQPEEQIPMKVPVTAFDYEWTLFVYGLTVDEGKLDLYDYKGTLWLPKEAEPLDGRMEVIENGFTFRTTESLINVNGIKDPTNEQYELRTGMITYANGNESPLTIRRLK
jgi:hypothetical protein